MVPLSFKQPLIIFDIWIASISHIKDKLIDDELKLEIKDAVQTFNYQVNTLQTSNGQSPFLSVCIYLNENPEYTKEVAMLAEEFFKQRLDGMKNKFGIKATQTFPKLLYFLDENNTYEGSEYFYLTKLAVQCTALRMNPDYMSVKKMKQVIGYAFPTMGCRAILSPWFIDGKPVFYGRGNLGVQTVNLPFVALESKRDEKDFFEVLDKYLSLCRRMGELRYEKLKGVKASVAPILWQYGAISRLNPNDDIIDEIERDFLANGMNMLVHPDPVVSDDTETGKATAALMEIINGIDKRITVHDIRIVGAPEPKRVIFDCVLPPNTEHTHSEIRDTVTRRLCEK